MKLFTILVAFLLLSACSTGKPSSLTLTKDKNHNQVLKKFHGTWVLYKDDEYIGQTFPDEKLYFHSDGQLLVNGPNYLCGKYDVINDNIQIIAPVKGYEVAYLRKFILEKNRLHLKNDNKGFAHYKRLNEMLEYCVLDEDWDIKSIGFMSFKVPKRWIVQGELPNRGLQELQLINPDASKLLLAVRIPTPWEYPKEELVKITKNIASQMMIGTPLAGFRLKPAGVDNYFEIKGFTYQTQRKDPDFILKAVIKQLRNSAVLLFVLYSSDRLDELGHIAKLIYMDGEPIASP